MSAQRDRLFARIRGGDGHRAVGMTGGEELVVRAPCPCANSARMGYLLGQQARVGVPDLDGAVLSPGSDARTAGAKGHGQDWGFVPPQNMEFPSGAHLPDMNRTVAATRGQPSAIGAPREPLDPAE